MRNAKLLTWLLALGVLTIVATLPARANENPPRVEIVQGVQHAVTPPVRQLHPTPPSPASALLPLRHPATGHSKTFAPDPALQTTTTTATSSSTSSIKSFDGIGSDGYIPPDTNLAVGATQVVETVNVEYAVYDKNGHQIQAPIAIHNIFASLGAPCGTSDGGDPVVLYDQMANRWLISQLEYNRPMNSNYECVAVSTSSDATGRYNVYALSFGSNLPDYPKWGVWPDGYYLSANIFYRGSSFRGAVACALPRGTMLTGGTIPNTQVICFQDPSEASFLPADFDGARQPSPGEPEYFANFDSTLELYRFHADFANPGNSTFTGPLAVSGADPFSEACGGGACVPQPGTNQQLDSLGDRLMFRLSYRNFGTYESLLVSHSVQVNSSGQTGIRWYEIRSPNATPAIYQQGTYSPDTSTYRWMSSIAQDHDGDIAVGYSVSNGSSTSPGIRIAGRLFGDPLDTLETESTVISGSGYQSSYNRWGDYSSMSIDPSDDCTFWYANEYRAASGSFNWNTRIASFKFSGCGVTSAPAAPTGLSTSPGDTQVTLTWSASTGATSYNVYRSTSSSSGFGVVASPTSASYTDTGLTNGTTYYYYVKAANSVGESGASNTVNATPQAPTAPSAPTNLVPTTGNDQVGLTWSASSGASSYNVYRSTSGSVPTKIGSSGSTNYTDTGVTNGTSYSYYVTAVGSTGLESAPSNTVNATPQAPSAPTTPNAPTALSASPAGRSGKINLSWTQSTSANITQNRIYRDDGTGSGYTLLATLSATTSYTDSSGKKSNTYCYEVSAVNSSGLESPLSQSACAVAGGTAK